MPFSARQGFFHTAAAPAPAGNVLPDYPNVPTDCLLYTSDAADE